MQDTLNMLGLLYMIGYNYFYFVANGISCQDTLVLVVVLLGNFVHLLKFGSRIFLLKKETKYIKWLS